MNIYQHVEVLVREIDSKLLLAILAAARGHQVLLSDVEILEKGIKRGILAPGIFHTKSLTPSESKIARHQAIIDKGSLISSMDEEGGLVEKGYEYDAKFRFSDQSIEQASAIFGWGPEDIETLSKVYSKYSSKMHKTGSPRVDLWRSSFSNYWDISNLAPKKPFLLAVSHMSHANYVAPFHNIISASRKSGRIKRDPNWFSKKFGMAAEHHLAIAAFIEAIEYFSKFNNDYDIVLRPHPTESVYSWKVFLEGIPNVHVIREGSVTAWVNMSFAVMHNGCTTGLEAIVSDKPLITYLPFKQDYGNEISTGLGYRVETKEVLLSTVNQIFQSLKIDSKSELENLLSDKKKVFKKIFLDENELSAKKIIKVWESLANNDNKLSQPNNWIKFKIFLIVMKFKGIIGRLLNKIFPKNFSQVGLKKDNFKFPPLDQNDIIARINRLRDILGIKEKIDCKFLSDKTILIKRCR